MRRFTRPSIAPLLLSTLVLGIGGCGSNRSDVDRSDEPNGLGATGKLAMPLVTEANGHTYRLSNLQLYLSGPTSTTLYSSTAPSETVLSATLTTGDYSTYLYSWSLERDDGSGNFVGVQATLTQAPGSFSIFAGTTTTISYKFQTDGVVVTAGSGQLRVRADVDETTPLCEILGAGCAAGTWCAPAELTGRPLQCIAAGAQPVGASCNGPGDCVANASCFDLGSGPTCVALCTPADFDMPCASGGTCTKRGTEYGACE